ncbi:MAG: hypothetical protein RQ743_08125 [Bacteroidales bacterium]|nr:hypothetical protein [Bacteroidales bacterium]
MKKINLLLILLFVLSTLNAQRNPLDEILVYFSSGVIQSISFEKDKVVKTAKISSDSLKNDLRKIGIHESMLHIAIPSFEKKDTLTILDDNTKLTQIDMTKLFRVELDEDMPKDLIISKLIKLPYVLWAESNSTIVSCATTPNDEFFQDEQWNLKNSTTPGADIHATDAWDIYKGNPNNIIAIVDFGLDSHDDRTTPFP